MNRLLILLDQSRKDYTCSIYYQNKYWQDYDAIDEEIINASKDYAGLNSQHSDDEELDDAISEAKALDYDTKELCKKKEEFETSKAYIYCRRPALYIIKQHRDIMFAESLLYYKSQSTDCSKLILKFLYGNVYKQPTKYNTIRIKGIQILVIPFKHESCNYTAIGYFHNRVVIKIEPVEISMYLIKQLKIDVM
jgi:hypothetical protein